MRGFSLTELLVCLVLISGSVLVVTRLHIQALRHSQHAFYLSVAANQAANLAALMQIRKGYKLPHSVFKQWQNLNRALLPEGRGDYDCDVGCRIDMKWREPDGSAALHLNPN